MTIILIIILAIIVLVSLILGYIERKDLVDRLMSKDLIEYKSLKEEPNQLEDENQNLISVFDAKEEILNEGE